MTISTYKLHNLSEIHQVSIPIFIFMGNNLESNLNMFFISRLNFITKPQDPYPRASNANHASSLRFRSPDYTLNPSVQPQTLTTLPVYASKVLITLSTLWFSLKTFQVSAITILWQYKLKPEIKPQSSIGDILFNNYRVLSHL